MPDTEVGGGWCSALALLLPLPVATVETVAMRWVCMVTPMLEAMLAAVLDAMLVMELAAMVVVAVAQVAVMDRVEIPRNGADVTGAEGAAGGPR